MNKFLKDMLMSRYGGNDGNYGNDGRNPYGSRGGYVVSSRRDREMNDMARRNDYGDMRRDMRDMDYARNNRGGDRERYDGNDYHYHYGVGGMYNPRMDYNYDMARGDRNDYGYDYGEAQFGKMSKQDYEDWGKMLENEDGTRGEHFKKDQVEQIAKQMGVNLESVGGEKVFCMAMNMLYSDFCAVARKYGVDRPEYYADLAKAFLHDKDYKGNPEEKLWAYYKCIVEKED